MIAAITNYYNPANRPEKLKNYQTFRERLGDIPLYVVEAAFGDQPFVLDKDPNTIQVRCEHVIWQQYTLINLGIQKLPDKYDKAVWVDADIIFDDPDWVYKMSQLLDQYKVAQSYSTITMDVPNGKGDTFLSVAKKAIENAAKPVSELFHENLDLDKRFASGFSWGVQRDVIEKHRIYDYWITGSCDTAFIIAIWGDYENMFFRRMNEKMRKHYMEWAIPFHEYVNHSVGCLETHIHHLWHGYRNYRKRWLCLKDMDPYEDIEVGENGCLRWRTAKPDLHRMCEHMCKEYDIDFKPIL